MKDWTQERVLFSPTFTQGDRIHLQSKGFMARDLNDYAALF